MQSARLFLYPSLFYYILARIQAEVLYFCQAKYGGSMQEVKRIRNERGWSQRQLATEAGVDQVTVNHIETGKRSPNVETLEKLARALDVEVGDFFPKIQAPLLDFDEQRRGGIYDSWFDFVNQYAKRWERQIAQGVLEPGAIHEFTATLEAVAPTLHRLGIEEKQAQPPEYQYSYGPVTGKAIGRLMDLLTPLMKACVEQEYESELSRLRRQHEQFGKVPMVEKERRGA